MSERTVWHIITSEYPPQRGGVSDYCSVVAAALARVGDEVHVWCPPSGEGAPGMRGVTVHRELGAMGRRDFVRLDHLLAPFPGPRRFLVQWVPHGFGHRAMNPWVCLWTARRARRAHDIVDLVVHEPFLPFEGGAWRHAVVALVQRAMATMLMRHARRIYVTIPAWETLLRPYLIGGSARFQYLPVPSTIAVIDDAGRVKALRARYGGAGVALLGHFGTHGRAGTALLLEVLGLVLEMMPPVHLVLIGRGGHELREQLTRTDARWASRIFATGQVDQDEVSAHLSVCDVMLHPFPGGVNSRHTSMMASLAHGRPVVTTGGVLTEPFWRESRAIALVDPAYAGHTASRAVELMSSPTRRQEMGVAAQAFYERRFDVRHLVSTLRANR